MLDAQFIQLHQFAVLYSQIATIACNCTDERRVSCLLAQLSAQKHQTVRDLRNQVRCE